MPAKQKPAKPGETPGTSKPGAAAIQPKPKPEPGQPGYPKPGGPGYHPLIHGPTNPFIDGVYQGIGNAITGGAGAVGALEPTKPGPAKPIGQYKPDTFDYIPPKQTVHTEWPVAVPNKPIAGLPGPGWPGFVIPGEDPYVSKPNSLAWKPLDKPIISKPMLQQKPKPPPPAGSLTAKPGPKPTVQKKAFKRMPTIKIPHEG